MSPAGILSTLQKLATALERLDELADDVRELRLAATGRIERLEEHISDLRERVARLEAAREADLAKMQAEIARFKAEVERAELRFQRRPALPRPRGSKSG
jgi:chromosome segregation ATPase